MPAPQVFSRHDLFRKQNGLNNLLKLSSWERGIRIDSPVDPNLFAFFWFYEWHLFDAVEKGEHTRGKFDWDWTVSENNHTATMNAGWLKCSATANEADVDLTLEITNQSNHDWPDIAAIIPCFNPGSPNGETERNPLFLDKEHSRTYFFGQNGLDLIKGNAPREIHFNHQCRPGVMSWDKEQDDGAFVFDEKWPTSDRDAHAGIMIRESNEEQYVMGIAWEYFLSSQGHNPWNCMHLSIKVGPLEIGETKTISGRIYLLQGNKNSCMEKFSLDFPRGKK